MPTLHFLLYLLILALVFLFRVSYIGWFGPFLLWATLLVPPLLLVLSLPSMLRLRVGLQAPDAVTKGEDGELLLRFEAGSLLPVRKVLVQVDIENRYTGEQSRERCRYRMLTGCTAPVDLPTGSCGQLVCSITRIEVRDLLGLIAIRRKCPSPIVCTVLPQAKGPAVPLDLDDALDTAEHLIPKYGGGYSEEHDLREYRPGDTVNTIHWKLSSKTDQVIVREPLVPRDKDIFLVLSSAGKDDRGLELLYWLSKELCVRELPHIIVADALYDVAEDADAVDAITTILSRPKGGLSTYDPSTAKCVFLIHEGEVRR